jgi:hypothetical protein
MDNLSFVIRKGGLENFAKNAQLSDIALAKMWPARAPTTIREARMLPG